MNDLMNNTKFLEQEYLKLSELSERWGKKIDHLLNLISEGFLEAKIFYRGYGLLENRQVYCHERFFLIERELFLELVFKGEVCVDYIIHPISHDRICPARMIDVPKLNKYKNIFDDDSDRLEKISIPIRKDDIVIEMFEVKRIEGESGVDPNGQMNCVGYSAQQENEILPDEQLNSESDGGETSSGSANCEKGNNQSSSKDNGEISTRERNNYLILIDSQMAIIRERWGKQKLPLTSDKYLISLLLKKVVDDNKLNIGFRRRSLERVFGKFKSQKGIANFTDNPAIFIANQLYFLLRETHDRKLSLETNARIIDFLVERSSVSRDISKALIINTINEADEKFQYYKNKLQKDRN